MSSWEEYKKTMVVESNVWTAAKDNDTRELARLLDLGAEIDATDSRGYSALMLAAYAGHREAFDFLVGRGADPNSMDAAGNTVVMGAAFKGHAAMVETLARVGANLHARNHAGMDAKAFATMFGRAEIAALLDRLTANTATDTPEPRGRVAHAV